MNLAFITCFLVILGCNCIVDNRKITSLKRKVRNDFPNLLETRKLETSTELTLSDYYEVEYIGIISAGTPAIKYDVIYDTGSSDVWLPSVSCTTCYGHTLFNSSASTSYISTNQKFSITY